MLAIQRNSREIIRMAPSIGLDFWRTLPVVEWARDREYRYVAVSRNASRFDLDPMRLIGHALNEVHSAEVAAELADSDDRAWRGEAVNGITRIDGRVWLYSVRREGDVLRGLAVPLDAFTSSAAVSQSTIE